MGGNTNGGGGGKGGGRTIASQYQGAVNQDSASQHPNVSGAFGGGQQWTQDKNGNWTESQSLGGGLGSAAGNLTNQIASNSGQPLPTGDAARQQAIDASYKQATSRLDPQFQQQQTQLNDTLSNEGLDPNSAAAQLAQKNFGLSKNDAYTSAMNSAIGSGAQAGSTIFNEGLQSASVPYQQLGALQGFVPQQGGVQGENLQGQQAYNQYILGQRQQTAGDITGGVQAGGAIAGAAFSDARLKENIDPLAQEVIPGVPLTLFNYKGSSQPYVGAIAQDVEQAAPEHVATDPATGMKMVSPSFQPYAISKAQRDAIKKLNTSGERSEQIQRQLAQAQALGDSNMSAGHTSPIGAALAGVGDIVNKVSGGLKKKRALADEQSLMQDQRLGRDAYTDAALGQQDQQNDWNARWMQARIDALGRSNRGGNQGDGQ